VTSPGLACRIGHGKGLTDGVSFPLLYDFPPRQQESTFLGKVWINGLKENYVESNFEICAYAGL
jgi:hypothetical protein